MRSNIRKKQYKATIMAVVVIFSILYLIGATRVLESVEDGSTYPGFDIDKYSIYLDVQKDNRVFVTETIGVNWTEGGHHGILRFIPRWLKYTGKDNKTIKRKAAIYDIEVEGENFEIDEVKKKTRIKVGRRDVILGTGYKTYTIKYTYDMGSDPYKGFDEFIFHAFGDYWGTPINNASLVIKMPENIDKSKVHFFTDKYRKEDAESSIGGRIEGNTIYVRYYGNLYSSLTVDIELPDGYFFEGNNNYGTGSLNISIGIIAMTLVIIFMWYICGKDYKKKPRMVEFYPPDNINAAELGYIYGDYYEGKKLPVSLIIQLAAKEYIQIIDIDNLDNKERKKYGAETGLIIKNLIPKPLISNYKESAELINGRVIKIKKLKNPGDDLSLDELFTFNNYFKHRNTATITTGIEEFLKMKDKLVNSGCIEILVDNYDKLASSIKKENTVKEEDYDKEIALYNEKLSKKEPLSELEQIIYDSLFIDGQDEVTLRKHETLYKAFNEVNSKMDTKYAGKIVETSSIICTILAIIMDIAIFILSIHSYTQVEDLDPKLHILYYISFACIYINLFFIYYMDRKSQYYTDLTVRIEGFKNFLETVEKPKLEELVEENPKYFYNILPYTYVLGISKKWIEKFEDIPMPQVDMGNFNYGDSSSYSSISNSVYEPTFTISSGGSSSGGCSSCGGGCSSCGGGCSSCGGGGSW